MADGVGVGRAIEALYCAAVSEDPSPMERAITQPPGDAEAVSRERLEEYVYAYACAVSRTAAVTLRRAPAMANEQHEPLDEAEVGAACRALAATGPTSRMPAARYIAYTLCCRRFRAREWAVIETHPAVACRARMIRLVVTAARTCTYATFGDRYIDHAIRLKVLPVWAVTTTPAGVAPHEVVNEIMPGREANDAVRGIIDTPIGTLFAKERWAQRSAIAHTLIGAATVLQELTGGHPNLLMNEGIVRGCRDGVAAVAVARGMPAGGGTFVGVVVGGYGESSDCWAMPAADCLVQWLVRAREHGMTATRDLAAAIIDNDPTSAAHQSYLQIRSR